MQPWACFRSSRLCVIIFLLCFYIHHLCVGEYILSSDKVIDVHNEIADSDDNQQYADQEYIHLESEDTTEASNDESGEAVPEIGKTFSQLPDCSGESNQIIPGSARALLLVSTLDGYLVGLDLVTGTKKWQHSLGHQSLHSSSSPPVELIRDGTRVRVVGSLDGLLYTVNEEHQLTSLPVSADSLISASYMIGDGTVISGSKVSNVYGIASNSGVEIYHCDSDGCHSQYDGLTAASDGAVSDVEDVLLIKKVVHNVYAFDPIQGTGKFNFTAGRCYIELIRGGSCKAGQSNGSKKLFELPVPYFDLPNGLVWIQNEDKIELWKKKLTNQIVDAWILDGGELSKVDLLQPSNVPALRIQDYNEDSVYPGVYVGVHDGQQMYIVHSDYHRQRALAKVAASLLLQPNDALRGDVFRGAPGINFMPHHLLPERRPLLAIEYKPDSEHPLPVQQGSEGGGVASPEQDGSHGWDEDREETRDGLHSNTSDYGFYLFEVDLSVPGSSMKKNMAKLLVDANTEHTSGYRPKRAKPLKAQDVRYVKMDDLEYEDEEEIPRHKHSWDVSWQLGIQSRNVQYLILAACVLFGLHVIFRPAFDYLATFVAAPFAFFIRYVVLQLLRNDREVQANVAAANVLGQENIADHLQGAVAGLLSDDQLDNDEQFLSLPYAVSDAVVTRDSDTAAISTPRLLSDAATTIHTDVAHTRETREVLYKDVRLFSTVLETVNETNRGTDHTSGVAGALCRNEGTASPSIVSKQFNVNIPADAARALVADRNVESFDANVDSVSINFISNATVVAPCIVNSTAPVSLTRMMVSATVPSTHIECHHGPLSLATVASTMPLSNLLSSVTPSAAVTSVATTHVAVTPFQTPPESASPTSAANTPPTLQHLGSVSESSSVTVASDMSPRSRIMDYNIRDLLGWGGFGIVYMVYVALDDNEYALKRIPLPSKLSNQQRVLREVRVLAKLNHVNIVRYYSCWQESHTSEWIQEYDRPWKESIHTNFSETFQSPAADTTTSPDLSHLVTGTDVLHDAAKTVDCSEEILSGSQPVHRRNRKVVLPGDDDDDDDGKLVVGKTYGDVGSSDCVYSNSDVNIESSDDCGLVLDEADTSRGWNDSSMGVSSQSNSHSSDSSDDGIAFGASAGRDVTREEDCSESVQFLESSRVASLNSNIMDTSSEHAVTGDSKKQTRGLGDKEQGISPDGRQSVSDGSHRSRHAFENRNQRTGKRNNKIPRDFLYIQMELCDRKSLKDWLRQNIVRPKDKVLKYFLDIVNAVEHVHDKQLMHRDLKPSNIFFGLCQDDVVKVGDFGLVTHMGEDEQRSPSSRALPTLGTTSEGSQQHQHTQGAGTQSYMSPEQHCKADYDYKVDIFSMGLILFEMLWVMQTEQEKSCVMQQVRQLVFPEGFSEEHPEEHELLKLMLHGNASERPTTRGIRARQPLRRMQLQHQLDVIEETEHFALRNRHRRNTSNASNIELDTSLWE